MSTDPRFQHAIDLVTYIKRSEEYSSNFCIGVAGAYRRGCLSLHLELTEPITAYPDGHPDGEADREAEFQHLKAKIDAGADFIVTQLFYDVDAFLEWVKELRARGSAVFPIGSVSRLTECSIGITVPIIPGIMPLQTYGSFLRITKLCGTSVPPTILADLDKIKVSNLGRSHVVVASFLRSMMTNL